MKTKKEQEKIITPQRKEQLERFKQQIVKHRPRKK